MWGFWSSRSTIYAGCRNYSHLHLLEWFHAGPLGEHNFASKQANQPMAPLDLKMKTPQITSSAHQCTSIEGRLWHDHAHETAIHEHVNKWCMHMLNSHLMFKDSFKHKVANEQFCTSITSTVAFCFWFQYSRSLIGVVHADECKNFVHQLRHSWFAIISGTKGA